MAMNHTYDGLAGLEGERHTIHMSKQSMCMVIDDFRNDHGYVCPIQAKMLDDIANETMMDLKEVAGCALDTMPDVSCAAIARALGLKLHVVIGMSNGRHNKAKRKSVSRGIELAEVTREELIENYRAQWAQ